MQDARNAIAGSLLAPTKFRNCCDVLRLSLRLLMLLVELDRTSTAIVPLKSRTMAFGRAHCTSRARAMKSAACPRESALYTFTLPLLSFRNAIAVYFVGLKLIRLAVKSGSTASIVPPPLWVSVQQTAGSSMPGSVRMALANVSWMPPASSSLTSIANVSDGFFSSRSKFCHLCCNCLVFLTQGLLDDSMEKLAPALQQFCASKLALFWVRVTTREVR